MELVDEQRSFWEFVPGIEMPKAFLMTGKRREDPTYDNSSSSLLGRTCSPVSPGSDDSDDGSLNKSALFRQSTESAFNKIDKHELETGSMKSPFLPTSASAAIPGFYPGLFPHLYPNHYLPRSAEHGASSSSISSNFPSPFHYSGASIPIPGENKLKTDSPDKNMFYYVDPRIPFTNYFLNLTKLLNGTSKDYTATTPLGKMADEDQRADDREPPITPDSSISTSGKSRTETISSPESDMSSAENDEVSVLKELKVDIVPDRLNLSMLSDPRFMNPYSGGLLQPTPAGTILPLPGSGLFHPALMHLPGSAYRRYNPEKPAPVKKYKCDVCGKAFSRSNTLVTHKRIHTGDKPFKCEICARAFRQPGNLTRHRLTHTTVKPYVCPTCNKAFNRASNLHTHMRTHTSFKAFVCPYCGKGFHQKIDMKIHCYTHTVHTARPDASPL